MQEAIAASSRDFPALENPHNPALTNARHDARLSRSSRKKQPCSICLDDVDFDKMHEICRDHHRHHLYCASCVHEHLKSKVHGRELPRCGPPHCRRKLSSSLCKKFLAPKMHDLFDPLVKEASIPASDKLYCPNPKCSNLMSKTKALAANVRSVASTSKAEVSTCSRCAKCRSLFCINFKVMWHLEMSCRKYKKRESEYLDAADVKLKKLAGKEWRQCPRCSYMVELARGCNHVCCRCGHEFCYKCGSQWKDKKATCSCVLWDEENIIYRGWG